MWQRDPKRIRTLSVSQSSLMLSTSVRITMAYQQGPYWRAWHGRRTTRTHTLCHGLLDVSIATATFGMLAYKKGMRRQLGSTSA